MGLGSSLFLIAIGAILRFAVNVSGHGFNIHTIGIILMIVGIVGLVISLFWLTMASERRTTARVVRDDGVGGVREYEHRV